MPGQSSLDPHAILASLGITDAVQAEPVLGGADTALWRVSWQGESFALRVFRPEQAAVCEREVAVMQAASASGIPVPAVIRQGQWEDRPALLLSWIAGKPLGEQLLAHPYLIWRLGKAFGRTQAAIHEIAPPPGLSAIHWIEWAGDEPDGAARPNQRRAGLGQRACR